MLETQKRKQVETRLSSDRYKNPAYADAKRRSGKSEAERLREWRSKATAEELKEYRAKVSMRRASHNATERGKELTAATKKRSYEKKVEFINSNKVSCETCGEETKACLQFHHKDPSQKEGNVIGLASRSMARLAAEIEKCVVVCANCHIKIHAGLLDCPK